MASVWANRITKRGYKEVLTKDRGWVLEHTYVYEEHMGRRLRRNESVHHINEIKTDNRLCNLFACHRLEHNKAHKMGRVSMVKMSPTWHAKKCINCGQTFYGPPKMIKSRLRCRNSCKPPRIDKMCAVCQKEYTVPLHAEHVNHCSRRCRRQL
jgi:HNH endonuclease